MEAAHSYYALTVTAAQRAVQRIREEMAERHVSQRDLATDLKCSQGKIAKMLNGGVHLRINDVDRLAAAVGLRLSEVVRDRGLEFYAEMTPSELRLLERLRQRPQALHGLLQFLETGSESRPPRTSDRPTRGRPLTRDAEKKR